ncbi:MAG: hypothetical protein QOH17_1472, partial [Pseudonocardiales bacterium]|nr:hypothetical protein [Pseudonocardiales bacterium]
RARGMTLLAAPVTELTDSIMAVRLWLAGLSGLGLFVAYRSWLRVYPGYVAPIAALLFSSIWSVAYYAFQAMPNEWVAFAVLAATGHAVLYLRDGRTRHLGWIVLAMTSAALLRPSDAGFAAAGTVVACAVIQAPRRLRVRAGWAVLAGTVLGTAEWVVEAYLSFGGLGERIRAAQAEQGGGGLRFSGLAQARALAGPLLCRTGCHAHAPVVFWFWWVVGAGLVLAAIVLGRHCFRAGPGLFVLVVAVATAAQYLLTVGYAAPRFLIPPYALLALPCASAIVRLCTRAQPARAGRGLIRVGVTSAFVVVLLAHLAVQGDVVIAHIRPAVTRFNRQVQADAAALHALGVRPPCVVLGQPSWNEALAYAAGCRNVPRGVGAVQRLRALGTDVVWLGPTSPPDRYGLSWRQVTLPGPTSLSPQVAYLSQASRPG